MINTIEIKVKENDIDIKNFLKKLHVGRGKIEEIRNINQIYVNEKKVSLDYNLKQNDSLRIASEEKTTFPIASKIQVLYEDENYIIVFKMKNILVHDDGSKKETLMNYVAYHLKKENKNPILYPVQRLDYETTGVIVFAKNFISCAFLSHIIENHEVEKKYVLMCEGTLKNKKGTLKFFLGKDRHNAKKMVVLKNKGQIAITDYEVIAENGNYSTVLVKLLTGRKHQIRVSFARINHSLIGDKLYGKRNDNEDLKLSSVYLSFFDKITNRKICAKIDLKKALDEL